MRRGEFIETVEGQLSLRWKRKLRRFLVLMKQEPRSKGAITAEERLAFQRKLLKFLSSRKRRPYRGPIVADLHFSTTAPNPPELHTLAKTYLDLMQGAEPGLGTGKRRLVCLDDRQVEVLSVSAHHAEGVPRIDIDVQPLADLRADLALLDMIPDLLT